MRTEDALTTLRVILAPAVAALIIAGKVEAAAYVYIIAAVTDIFDGYFARKNKKKRSARTGDVFDSLADLTLVYFAVFALLVVHKWMWLSVLMIVSLALTAYVIGVISMKSKELTIPHLKSAKVWAWLVHPTILAYIVEWQHAGTLLLLSLVVGAFTALEYIVYALKHKGK